jgi:hypothetical protein
MAFPLPSRTPPKISWKYRPPQISYVLRSCHSLSQRGRSHPRQILHHLSRGRCSKLVLQAPARMHSFLATTQRKVPTQFPGFPSGARYRRRFFVLFLSCAQREKKCSPICTRGSYSWRLKLWKYQTIKSALRLSKPCVWGPYTTILSGSDPK